MVDQAQVSGTNGSGESAPRMVARNFAEFLHDVMTLGELQLQLAKLDFKQCLGKLVVPAVAVLFGVILLLSCLPIALVCIAFAFNEFAELSLTVSFLLALAIGLVVGALVALAGAWYFRKGLGVLRRSQEEFMQNIRWIKTVLKRLGGVTSARRESEPLHTYRY
jgi:hypothetical protein